MADKKDITLSAEEVKVSPQGAYDIEVSLEQVEAQQIVELIEVEEFVQRSDVTDILGHIDLEDVIDFYGNELVDKIKEDYDLVESE